jgi:hypothetical protein
MGGIKLELRKKECEYCHESIDEKSRRCTFCGSLLSICKSNEDQNYLRNQEHQEKQDDTEKQDSCNDENDFDNLEGKQDNTYNMINPDNEDLSQNYVNKPISDNQDQKEADISKSFTNSYSYTSKSDYNSFDRDNNRKEDKNNYNLYNNPYASNKKSYTKGRDNYTINRGNYSVKNNYSKSSLSNGMKVFITVIASVVPGLGQIVGIILAIIFMNSEDDLDKRSFGVALLISSLILFVIACFSCFLFTLFAGEIFQDIPYKYNF